MPAGAADLLASRDALNGPSDIPENEGSVVLQICHGGSSCQYLKSWDYDGTPHRVGVSCHKSYWDANPGTFEKLANSYRINTWKQ